MTSRKKREIRQKIPFEEHNFEKVSEFKYLESMLTNDNDEIKEVKTRIKTANSAYYATCIATCDEIQKHA